MLYPYPAHVFFSHAELVVAQQEGPDFLADFVLDPPVVNQPQQLQLLVVLQGEEGPPLAGLSKESVGFAALSWPSLALQGQLHLAVLLVLAPQVSAESP